MNNNQLDISIDRCSSIQEKYRDYYYRTGISMYRYNKEGSGRDLLQTMADLVNFKLHMSPLSKLDVFLPLNSFLNEDGTYELPYDRETYLKDIELVKSIYEKYMKGNEVFVSDSDTLKVIESVKRQLDMLDHRLFEHIYVVPFSDSFDPKAYMEAEQITEADFPPQAKKEWQLSFNTNYFFWLVLTSNYSLELFYKFFSLIRNNFKPCHPVIATDIYKMALQLPLDFIKALFYSFEHDAVRYSQIISSIEHKQEKEFLASFHECNIESFGNHYYSFAKLALAFFKMYSQELEKPPIISEYINSDSRYLVFLVSIINEVLYRSHKTGTDLPDTREFNVEDIIVKHKELLHESSPAEIVSPKYVVKTEEKKPEEKKPEEKPQKGKSQVTKDTTCYLSSDTIHKRFDVSKLVTLLTSKNEFTDKSYVELGEDNNQSLKDCLTYFFFPDDDIIKNKIENHEFNVKFKLRWKGRHAVSLKCLVRLLSNTKEWKSVKDVYDENADDRLSRENVSMQDDKSPIWKPVTEVFAKKAISNAGIDEKASNKTIEANEREIKEIIKIVFECKK